MNAPLLASYTNEVSVELRRSDSLFMRNFLALIEGENSHPVPSSEREAGQ
jgi:hypothetical protein